MISDQHVARIIPCDGAAGKDTPLGGLARLAQTRARRGLRCGARLYRAGDDWDDSGVRSATGRQADNYSRGNRGFADRGFAAYAGPACAAADSSNRQIRTRGRRAVAAPASPERQAADDGDAAPTARAGAKQ